MKRLTGFFRLVLVLLSVSIATAEQAKHMAERSTLTENLWGLNETLEPMGIDFAFNLTSIYQINAKGGLSTHRRKGRWSGSYDVEMNADLERILGIEGGTLYVLSEGTWSQQDIDDTSVGSAFGVNGDFSSREALNIVELWYLQSFFEDMLQLRIGKLDMTGGFECRGSPVSFDGNMYANDETTQFLNTALVNNPTIPFPDYGLGVILHWNPLEHWYLSVGAADAQADKRETGFNTTFHGEESFVYIAETGITPQLDLGNGPHQGSYRVGVWYDPHPKSNSDSDKEYRDDVGLYLSFDQKLTCENNDPEDTQGLGSFFRYGYAPSRTNDIACFYSFGFQYQGLFEGRDSDVLGLGYAHGTFSDLAETTYTEDYESATELYFSAPITAWMTLTPSLQYVTHPGGNDTPDAVVLGIRAQISF